MAVKSDYEDLVNKSCRCITCDKYFILGPVNSDEVEWDPLINGFCRECITKFFYKDTKYVDSQC